MKMKKWNGDLGDIDESDITDWINRSQNDV